MLSLRNAVVNVRSVRFVSIILIFISVTVLVQSGITSNLDESIISGVTKARNPPLDAPMMVITFSADLTFSPMIIFSLILLIKRKTRKIGAILLISIAITTVVSLYVKQLVDRERPSAYELETDLGFFKIEKDALSRFAGSFPSGHAARSAAFALIVSYMIRNKEVLGVPASLLMWVFPTLIAFTRIYVGEHYPTDVIGGVLLGLIVANVLGKILQRQPAEELRI